MYTYITSGTYEFLNKVKEKYSNENILLLQGNLNCELWHETTGATIFQAPRKYEIIGSIGDLAADGLVACTYMPIRDEGRPNFEFKFTKRIISVKKTPGFIALRLLRPLSNNSYIVMTMWENDKAYDAWNRHQSFLSDHNQAPGNPDIFAGPSYTSKFLVTEDQLETE